MTKCTSISVSYEASRARSDGCMYVISDIHSNFPALEAVLSEIPDDSFIVCCGDIVSYYVNPNEVCDALRSRNILCIKGNHDKYILDELPYSPEREEKYRIKYNKMLLNRENLEWLKELPDEMIIDDVPISDDSRVLVVHGSPRNHEEYIYPDTSVTFSLEQLPRLILSGHTHHPMLRKVNTSTIVNPGSVGQPRDWKPGACYAKINIIAREISFVRACYDIDRYQHYLLSQGTCSDMIEVLSREK
jgi:putative phosphoesterase